MPEGSPPNQPSRKREQAAAAGNLLDQTLWKEFSTAETVDRFSQAWLGLQARMIGGVSGGAVALGDPAEGPPKLVAAWPAGFKPLGLKGVFEKVLKERRGVVTRSDATGEDSAETLSFAVGYPVWARGALSGVAALQIAPRPQVQLQSAMRQLQWGVAWLENWILRTQAAPAGGQFDRLAIALELAGMVLEEPRFQGAATTVATELATRLDCDRVSIGFLEGTQVKVHALSHSAQFGKQMNLIRSIGMAIGEATDQQSVLIYPEKADQPQRVLHAHEQLARTHGDGAVCTVPFITHGGTSIGGMTLERSVSEPFDEATVNLCDSVGALIGPILDEKRKNDRLLIRKAWDSLWTQIERLFGPRYTARKLTVSGLILLTLFLVFAKGTYRVTAKTILEGEIQRVVTAPYRGFIYEAPVRGGDIVSDGQTMALLDVRDLRLEYSRWTTEREQFVLEQRRAMAEGDRAKTNVLGKKIHQAEAQLALLDEQIARATITAPFNGIVVSGDLSQSLGSPVEGGDVLFEVAPLQAYRVTLQVDERDIGNVHEGQVGELILTAMPQEKLKFTVKRVTPLSVSEEGRNYFTVEASLNQASERLRPGMQGFGKIEIDRRKLIWIWTHDLIDWVRLKLWTWRP